VRRPTAAPVAASARAVGNGSSYTVADNMQPRPRSVGGQPRTWSARQSAFRKSHETSVGPRRLEVAISYRVYLIVFRVDTGNSEHLDGPFRAQIVSPVVDGRCGAASPSAVTQGCAAVD
jgi:hypothetical protein